jgi:hypothetical protein
VSSNPYTFEVANEGFERGDEEARAFNLLKWKGLELFWHSEEQWPPACHIEEPKATVGNNKGPRETDHPIEQLEVLT